MSNQRSPEFPDSIKAFLEQNPVRSFEDVIDYASVCARAVAEQGLTAGVSKELRMWGELMYTCIHSQNSGDSSVSVIGQLIQIAGTDAVEVLGGDLVPTLNLPRGDAESTTVVPQIEESAGSTDDFGGFIDILEVEDPGEEDPSSSVRVRAREVG